RFSQNNTFTAAPQNGAPQWHGKFYSTQLLGSTEFVALMRVGCQASAASAAKKDGVWTVNAGAKTITINDAGTISVGAPQAPEQHAPSTGTAGRTSGTGAAAPTAGGTTASTGGATTPATPTTAGTTTGTQAATQQQAAAAVASSMPYTGTPFAVPGTLEA